MKALTVRQPFASFIADGSKSIELRSWTTNHRGPLLICASAKPLLEPHSKRYWPHGVSVCEVDVLDVRLMRPEDAKPARSGFDPSLYAWVLSKPRRVIERQIKGKLRIFDVDDS
jgi:hypothetical protein